MSNDTEQMEMTWRDKLAAHLVGYAMRLGTKKFQQATAQRLMIGSMVDVKFVEPGEFETLKALKEAEDNKLPLKDVSGFGGNYL